MSEGTNGDRAPLDRFLEQWWRDRDRGQVLSLDEYLARFPGDTEGIAREYLALKGSGGEADAGEGAAAPRQIAHYRILRELGGGGQGVVYLARDLRLSREVAIKKLHRQNFTAENLERFGREARIASRLDHPGICPIYDISEDAGEPYFVMRYVEGTTLAAKINDLRSSDTTIFRFVEVSEGGQPQAIDAAAAIPDDASAAAHRRPAKEEIATVLRLIEQVARALHEAHEAGVIHRDIKPANVIVSRDGQPVLLDFGLATMTHGDVLSVTQTGQTPGTPAYMSPEQMAGGAIALDRRTDVYSLGVTLYECLTLTRPFDRSSQVARQVLFVDAPDPRRLNPAISSELRTVIRTALEKDRDRRYPTAAELADDLRRVREHEPIKARPVGPIMRAVRWAQRKPAIAASLLSVFLILSGALIVTLDQRAKLRHALSLSEPMADLQQANELKAWSGRLWPAVPRNASGPDGMEEWLAEAQALLGRSNTHEESLRRFSDPAESFDPRERRQRVRVLEELKRELFRLPAEIAEMQRRLESARTLAHRTIDAHRDEWRQIAEALGADPRFAAVSPLPPQLGLIPLAKNNEGWFEFLVADTGSVPRRDPDTGDLQIEDETGLVLVLLPGGRLRFSRTDRAGGSPAPDPANLTETTIEPFFMGKHEVSQAQWKRLAGSNPSFLNPEEPLDVHVTLRHPVESITWHECTELCRRLGLLLPSQDQWEFAARSTSGFEWGECAESRCLEGRENLADRSLDALPRSDGSKVAWRDDHRAHAPIDTYLPNGYGLHHVLGNVTEWCGDRFKRPRLLPSVAVMQAEAGGELPPSERRRVIRGSNYSWGVQEAGCGWFAGLFPGVIQPRVGVRVVRSLDG